MLVLSTGVIGTLLPLEKVLGGLRDAVPALSDEGGSDAAEAILTTDTRTKEAAVSHATASPSAGWRRAPG